MFSCINDSPDTVRKEAWMTMHTDFCRNCITHGMYTPVDPRRVMAGFSTCLPCGEDEAREVKHTIVPMHKSNYVVISDRRDLAGINNKGGFYR